jgi:small subunit ribosomal protein S16
MVRIRFRRVGSKNQATFRIVAADRESPRDGRFLEVIGHYNPRTEPSTIKVDEARLFHWMKNGAQPSESVHQALRALGTWDRWERFKSGEDLELLLKEAEDALVEVDPRTRRDDLIGERKMKGKARKKAAEAEAVAAEPAVEAEETAPEAEAEPAAVPAEESAAEEAAPPDEAPAEVEPEQEEAVEAAAAESEPADEPPAEENEPEADAPEEAEAE